MKSQRRLFTPPALGSWAWTLVRLPIYCVLLICEPMLRIGFTTISLLGLVAAVVLKFSGSAEHFPFWHAVLFFVCCGMLPVLHRAALRLFAP